MIDRVLPRVGLDTILASTGGLDYAIRYGVLEPTPHALDNVTSGRDLEAIADRALRAERAETGMRKNTGRAERDKRVRRKPATSKAPAE